MMMAQPLAWGAKRGASRIGEAGAVLQRAHRAAWAWVDATAVDPVPCACLVSMRARPLCVTFRILKPSSTDGSLCESFVHMRYKRLKTQAPAPSDAIGARHRPARPRHEVPSNPGTQWQPLSAGFAWERMTTTYTATVETNSQFHGRPSLTPSSASRCWHLAQLIPRLQPHGRRHSAEHKHHIRSPDTCCHRPSAPFGILSSSSANIVACALDAHRCSSSRNEGFCTSFACRSTQRIRTDQPEQRQAAEQAAEGSDALGVGAGTRAPSTASGLRDHFRSPQYRIVSDDPCIL